MSGPVFASDSDETARRLARLKDYFDEAVLGPRGFVCKSYKECRESYLTGESNRRFYEGVLHHRQHGVTSTLLGGV